MALPNPSQYSSPNAYMSALKQTGWKRVGSGVGGTVFRQSGTKFVLKVSQGDKCYLNFVDYVIQNPRPNLPKLQTIHRASSWAVTEIELLRPVPAPWAYELGIWHTLYLQAKKQQITRPTPAEWSSTADDLFALANSTGCGVDLKFANFMWRPSDKKVIFTDPLN